MTSPDLLASIREGARDLAAVELAGPILVGVSGGPDSLALLHLLWRWSRTGGPAIRALLVDHQLRPESAAEAEQVAATCAAWGVPFAVRTVDASAIAESPAGVEDAARRERYRLFADEAAACGAPVLALGHQADDQAETVLLHLLRGAGLGGLAALPLVRRHGDLLDTQTSAADTPRPTVWRPLLHVRRATIEAYCREHGIATLHDASNADTKFRRNAIRQLILPVIEQHVPGATAALGRGAALLADDEATLVSVTEEAWRRCARPDDELVWLDRAQFRAEERGVQRRLIRRAWQTASGATAITGLSAATVEAAREGLIAGHTGKRLALPGNVTLLIEHADVVLGRGDDLVSALRRRVDLPLVSPEWSRACAPGTIALASGWTVNIGVVGPSPEDADSAPSTLLVPDQERDDDAPLLLRTWQPGDYVQLGAGRGTQTLQDWFVNRHVPSYLRHHLPLLARDHQILWVVGLAALPPTLLHHKRSDTGVVLRLHYNGVIATIAGRWSAYQRIGDGREHGGAHGAAGIDRTGPDR